MLLRKNENMYSLSEENKQDIVSNDASETTAEFQPLVIIIKGGLHGNVKIEQGTWGHIEIARIVLIKVCSGRKRRLSGMS
jgi:hypothetical protein